jgi:hypothetical protein
MIKVTEGQFVSLIFRIFISLPFNFRGSVRTEEENRIHPNTKWYASRLAILHFPLLVNLAQVLNLLPF